MTCSGVAGATGEELPPFCQKPLEACAEGELSHLVGGEPLECEALGAGLWKCVFRCNEHVADVVMEMLGLRGARGDGMDVEVEGPGGGEDETCDARFLEGLALCDREDVLLAIAMAAELHPAVEIAVVMQERALSVGAEYKGASGEVRGERGAQKTAGLGVEQGDHAFAQREFVGTLGEVECGELGTELDAVRHGSV